MTSRSGAIKRNNKNVSTILLAEPSAVLVDGVRAVQEQLLASLF
jgi:hypothetical protein